MTTITTHENALVEITRPPIMDFVIGTTDDGCPILSTDAPDVCENIL